MLARSSSTSGRAGRYEMVDCLMVEAGMDECFLNLAARTTAIRMETIKHRVFQQDGFQVITISHPVHRILERS